MPAGEIEAAPHLICSAIAPNLDAVRFDPAWRTSTVVALAKTIATDGTFDVMPILADALQDAGCDNAVLLDHCRGCTSHTRNCWVLSHVLGPPLSNPSVSAPEIPPVERSVLREAAARMHENDQAVTCMLGFTPIAILALSPLLMAAVSLIGHSMVFSVCCIPILPFAVYCLVLCYRVTHGHGRRYFGR